MPQYGVLMETTQNAKTVNASHDYDGDDALTNVEEDEDKTMMIEDVEVPLQPLLEQCYFVETNAIVDDYNCVADVDEERYGEGDDYCYY